MKTFQNVKRKSKPADKGILSKFVFMQSRNQVYL